jgi:hypothetical protein
VETVDAYSAWIDVELAVNDHATSGLNGNPLTQRNVVVEFDVISDRIPDVDELVSS